MKAKTFFIPFFSMMLLFISQNVCSKSLPEHVGTLSGSLVQIQEAFNDLSTELKTVSGELSKKGKKKRATYSATLGTGVEGDHIIDFVIDAPTVPVVRMVPTVSEPPPAPKLEMDEWTEKRREEVEREKEEWREEREELFKREKEKDEEELEEEDKEFNKKLKRLRELEKKERLTRSTKKEIEKLKEELREKIKQKLEQLKTERFPLGFFNDDSEHIEEDKVGPLTIELVNTIIGKGGGNLVPLLMSATLFYNFVYRLKNWEAVDKRSNQNIEEERYENQNQKLIWKKMKDVEFNSSTWRLFDIPKTQFVLLVPKEYESRIKHYFRVDNFEDITSLLDNLDELIEHLKNRFNPEIKDMSQFRAIFWDLKKLQEEGRAGQLVFYVSGHSNLERYMAGFDGFSVALSFFEFFKGYLFAIFISSCYAGGQQTEFMRYYNKEKRILRSLPYFLIIQGISDVGVEDPIFYCGVFLKEMEQGVGRAIEDILKEISMISFKDSSLHGQTNLPQLLRPYGIRFFPLDLSDYFVHITKVMQIKHKMEIEPQEQIEFEREMQKPEMQEKSEMEIKLVRNKIKYNLQKKMAIEFTPNPLIIYVHVDDVIRFIKIKPLNLDRLSKKDEMFGDFKREKKEKQWKNFPVASEKLLELLEKAGGNRLKKIKLLEHLKYIEKKIDLSVHLRSIGGRHIDIRLYRKEKEDLLVKLKNVEENEEFLEQLKNVDKKIERLIKSKKIGGVYIHVRRYRKEKKDLLEKLKDVEENEEFLEKLKDVEKKIEYSKKLKRYRKEKEDLLEKLKDVEDNEVEQLKNVEKKIDLSVHLRSIGIQHISYRKYREENEKLLSLFEKDLSKQLKDIGENEELSEQLENIKKKGYIKVLMEGKEKTISLKEEKKEKEKKVLMEGEEKTISLKARLRPLENIISRDEIKEMWKDLFEEIWDHSLEKIWKDHFPSQSYDFQMHEISNFIFPLIFHMKKRGKIEGGVSLPQELTMSQVNVMSKSLSFNLEDEDSYSTPEMGVLHFLRDQLDVDDDELGMRIVNYKKVKGSNDISILFALIRHEKEKEGLTDLEKALGNEKTITLFDVQTEVGFDRHEGKVVRRVRFSFKDKVGKLRTWESREDGWNFVEVERRIEEPLEKEIEEKIEKARALMKGETRWEQDDASKLWRNIFEKNIDFVQAITSDEEVAFWVNRVKDGKDFELVQKIVQQAWEKKKEFEKTRLKLLLKKVIFKKESEKTRLELLNEKAKLKKEATLKKTILKLLIELVKEGKAIDLAFKVVQEIIKEEVSEDGWILWDLLIKREKGVIKAVELANRLGKSPDLLKQKKALNLWQMLLEKGKGVSKKFKEKILNEEKIEGFYLLLSRELIRSEKQQDLVKELISKIKNSWLDKTDETALKALEVMMEFKDDELQKEIVDRMTKLIKEVEKKTKPFQAKLLYAWRKVASIGAQSSDEDLREKSEDLFKKFFSFFGTLVKEERFDLINLTAENSQDEVNKTVLDKEATSWAWFAFFTIIMKKAEELGKKLNKDIGTILLKESMGSYVGSDAMDFLHDVAIEPYEETLSVVKTSISEFLQKKMFIRPLLYYLGYLVDDGKENAYEKALKTAQLGMSLNDEAVQLKALDVFDKLLKKKQDIGDGKKLIDAARKGNFLDVRKRAKSVWRKFLDSTDEVLQPELKGLKGLIKLIKESKGLDEDEFKGKKKEIRDFIKKSENPDKLLQELETKGKDSLRDAGLKSIRKRKQGTGFTFVITREK